MKTPLNPHSTPMTAYLFDFYNNLLDVREVTAIPPLLKTKKQKHNVIIQDEAVSTHGWWYYDLYHLRRYDDYTAHYYLIGPILEPPGVDSEDLLPPTRQTVPTDYLNLSGDYIKNMVRKHGVCSLSAQDFESVFGSLDMSHENDLLHDFYGATSLECQKEGGRFVFRYQKTDDASQWPLPGEPGF